MFALNLLVKKSDSRADTLGKNTSCNVTHQLRLASHPQLFYSDTVCTLYEISIIGQKCVTVLSRNEANLSSRQNAKGSAPIQDQGLAFSDRMNFKTDFADSRSVNNIATIKQKRGSVH
jgi:hypothetical protein